MEKSFNSLIPASDINDMNIFRKLLTLSVKVRSEIEFFTKQQSQSQFDTKRRQEMLKLKCFSLTFSLLSSELQQEYFSQNNNNSSLDTLINYLCGLIKTNAYNTAMNAENDEYSQLFKCQYCKKNGHKVNFCPLRMATFCFRCFQFGHSKKRCLVQTIHHEDIIF